MQLCELQQTCVVAIVRGEYDVGVAQVTVHLQLFYHFLYQVINGQQSLPPGGDWV